MVVTRSQSGDEGRNKRVPQRFEEASRSPSASTSGAATSVRDERREPVPKEVPATSHWVEERRSLAGLSHPVTTECSEPKYAEAASSRSYRHTVRPASPASVRSTFSTAQRIRQAELEAEEQLIEMRMKLEEELVRKRLAFRIASIKDEGSQRDPAEAVVDEPVDERIDSWLRESMPHATSSRGEPLLPVESSELRRKPTIDSRHPANGSHAPMRRNIVPQEDDTRQVEWNEPTPQRERPRSPTPTRYRDRGIEQLAEAIEKMARIRPPPRQVTDLPLFSGAPIEWLSYKAAMRDSTRLYNFSPVENMARLRNSLRGEAREAVAALLHSVVDPDMVMKTLERCFGRPEVIIDRAIEDIKKLPRPGTSSTELNSFAIKLQNIVCVLQSIDQRGYLNNPMLTREVIEKLSPYLRSRWCDYAEDYGSYDEPEIVTLSNFLMREADRGFRHAYSSSKAIVSKEKPATNTPTRRPETTRKAAFSVSTTAAAEKLNCMCCGGDHNPPKCSKFKELDIDARWEAVKGSGLCFKCLEKKHRRFSCKAKACGINECQRPHHSLLHPVETAKEEVVATKEAVMTTADTTMGRDSVLLKVCPVTITGPAGAIETFALLDEGSTVTLIDEDIANKIGADGPKNTLHIHGVNSVAGERNSKTVKLRVQGRNMDSYNIEARTMKDLTLYNQTVPTDVFRYPHLRMLKQEEVCYQMARPKILIGADNWHLIVTRQLRQGRKREPVASRTNLGWVILGTLPKTMLDENNEAIHHVHYRFQNESDRDARLEEMVKTHFHIDALGVSLTEKTRPEDERAVKIFNNTARRIGQRFEVGLPWRREHVKMPPSFDQEFRRLRTIERKMDRDAAFAESYTAQIENLLHENYTEECIGTEIEDKKAWFLPHFAMRNPNKPGKVRLVFNAAAVSNSTSLNKQLPSLPGISYRFRKKPIAVTAHQPVQIILWRGRDKQNSPKKYKAISQRPVVTKKISRVLKKSGTMSKYVPIGISSFTLATKKPLQSLRPEIGWDEQISQDEAELSIKWMCGLDNIIHLRLPRCYDPGGVNTKRDLYIFCNATEQAYATVAFWRIERKDGSIEVTLAASNAKEVALRKASSIPKMELQALVIGTRLTDAVNRQHRWTAEINTNGLRQIAERSRTRQWQGVSTENNRVDNVTRTNYAKGPRKEWLTGPEFRRQPRECWPLNPQDGNDKEEGIWRASCSHPTITDSWDMPTDRPKNLGSRTYVSKKRALERGEHVRLGLNGKIRSADIRMRQGSVFRRLRRKLVVLPVEGKAATSLRRGENVTDDGIH